MSLALTSLISNKVVPSPLCRAVKMPLIPELFTASTLTGSYRDEGMLVVAINVLFDSTVGVAASSDVFVGAAVGRTGAHAINANNT